MTISQKFNTVNTVKSQIKTAIENKGVTITPSDTFATYPSKINAIPDASEYIGYLDDVEDVLDDLGITVPAQYSDLDSTISSSYNAIYTELNNISGGTAPSVVLEPVTVTATTTSQTILPSTGVDGFDEVSVNAVTSAIDNNITAGNIKKDVTILGVTGTYEGSGGTGIPREVSAQGVYTFPSSSFTFSLPSNATDIGSYILYHVFYQCSSLTSADLSSLIEINGSDALEEAFRECPNLTTVDLSSLTTISGPYSLHSAFRECTNLTTVDLSSLTTVSGNSAMSGAFYHCSSLTSVDLSNLTNLGMQALISTFSHCTSLVTLSFPSLTSTSFGSYTNQFRGMLSGVTGCIVHFPSNLQSVIGNWTDVVAGFDGTNTTVLFDLPATT